MAGPWKDYGSKGDKSGIPAGGGPARGKGRGDKMSTPDNFAALKHGADSPRLWRPVADALASELTEVRPDLNAAHYTPAIRSWARIEAQLLVIADYAEQAGLIDPDGIPLKYVDRMQQFENSAMRARERLGLDPVSFTKLAKDRAEVRAVEISTDSALVSLQERGRKALERRRKELGLIIIGGTDTEDDHDDADGDQVDQGDDEGHGEEEQG